MKSIRLMAAALALVATTSFAASSVSLDTSGLTEAQIAELKIQALEDKGPDGLAMMVDMALWNDALNAFEGIIGDEME